MLLKQRSYRTIEVIDSHTGGEPTRVVISGGPAFTGESLSDKLNELREQYDHFRSAVVNEPRGSDPMVGALLCPPTDPRNTAGVIFFNNVGYLGMCGHGTIGLMITLAYLNRIEPGEHFLETPVGLVTAKLHEDGRVTIGNVPSYRYQAGVKVNVDGYGTVQGDVAWGGNWFYLVHEHHIPLNLNHLDQLLDFTWKIRQGLVRQGISGVSDAEIDHIELFAPSHRPGVSSQNFVLCPGRAYDRSPCGTGTSAKLACLYADGRLKEGQIWVQESIVGSIFEGSVQIRDNQIHPFITGTAHITAQAKLILDESDPFQAGIRG